MARITVEDCLRHVDNRFDLVLLAAKRARLLARGKVEPLIAFGTDKPTVLALREIGAGLLTPSHVEHIEEEVEVEEHAAELIMAQRLSIENQALDD